MSQFRNNISANTTMRENRTYRLSPSSIDPGNDYLVYDNYEHVYKGLSGNTYNSRTFDTDRFETNFDVIIGCPGNTVHAVAANDAYGYLGMVNDDTAAAPCYYRVEIDNSVSGGFTYTCVNGNGTYTGNVSWNAGDTMSSIANQITAGTYFTKAVTDDGNAIGISSGGYGANTFVLSNVTGVVNVRDMSVYAVYDKGVNNGDSYDSSLEVLSNSFKNWRGASAQTILGSGLIPVAANSSCIANTGKNYLYCNLINFTGGKTCMSTNGTASFTSDGVNGSAYAYAYPMKKAVFDANVNASATAGSNAAKMYEYYHALLLGQVEPYITMKALYESRYGTMIDEYDAYLMSHCVKENATSGIVYTCLNKGKKMTNSKGKTMTVDYNWKYRPAYPPEYNALIYGVASSTSAFKKGLYSHPEPYDLTLIFRDDLMPKINNRIKEATNYTLLTNSMYRGSVAECYAGSTWFFRGTYRTLDGNYRCYGVFRARPVLALSLD